LIVDAESATVPSMKVPKQYQVMDIAALAEYLGFTPSTVRTYIARKRWERVPKPSVHLTVSPIWYRGDVEEWEKKRK
jgi:predicted DNA-binding transcriptional regulator AlpA